MLFTPLLELKSSQEPSRYLDLARLQLVHELSCESRIGLRWTSCVKPFYILVVIHVLNHESRYFNAVLLRGSGNVLWKCRLSFQQHGGRR